MNLVEYPYIENKVDIEKKGLRRLSNPLFFPYKSPYTFLDGLVSVYPTTLIAPSLFVIKTYLQSICS